MRYSYQTNFDLYKLAMRTYIRTSPRRRFRFHFFMWGLFVIGLVVGLVILLLHNRFPDLSNAVLPLTAGAITGGLVTPLTRPWQLKRCYKIWNGEIKGHSVFVEVNGAELISGIEGRSESRFQRGAVCGTAEDENALLLFLNKKKFLYFSKSAIPQSTLDELRAWLQLPGAPEKC
jgi:hypothetical protein